MTTFKPRPKQKEVLKYKKGLMGVSAVPGSGKTRTLSTLAAQLVATAPLEEGQEVLIVTLVNSAVDHFARQVNAIIRDEYNLLPGFGYRVRTLHSLAGEIVRERPGLVGLAEDFVIVDEREANDILQDAVDTWVRTHPNAADAYLADEHMDNGRVRYQSWPSAVQNMANAFIRQAKDSQLTPQDIRKAREKNKAVLPLVDMGLSIYQDYQRGLAYRGAVDFQDLIRLALLALQLDKDYLKRLKHRWPYILEDEAQDSSKLQQDILALLAGGRGNWVRVGDPNQAIYETFTTANPRYLREFIAKRNVKSRELPNSGRSTRSIIKLANYLITWSLAHPVESIRERQPLTPPHIEPTPADDPQPNPPDQPDQVHIRAEKYTPGGETQIIVNSVKRWLERHPDETVAVLVPRNQRGFQVVSALKNEDVEYVEMLRSTSSTREVAGAIGNVLNFLSDPTSSPRLATVYRVWRREDRDDPEAMRVIDNVASVLEGCRHVEDFLWPQLTNWLEETAPPEDNPALYEHLDLFRGVVRRWQEAVLLPVDQLMLTISGDLFLSAADIAVAYSMALYLRRFAETHPDAQLPMFTEELARVARNERRYLGLSEDDLGFDPDQHRGKVTVATMHSAKGLEWDRVYLLSVNNYDFPSAQDFDTYMSEQWFARDGLNLEAETVAQLEAVISGDDYHEGVATQLARVEYAAERLRLLYVGITRARKELVITWNSGRKRDKNEALPLVALRTFWEKETSS